MQHNTHLRKRNKVVLSIVTANILLYATLSAISFFDSIYQFPYVPLLLCIVTFFLYRSHFNEKLVCATLIITINLTLIHMITSSMNIYFVIFLIFGMFVISIYQSAYLNTIVMISFGAEIFGFFYLWYPELLDAIGKTNLALLIIILSFLCAISLIQGFYFSASYRNIETKSDEVEMAFLSREGYLKLFFENAKDSIAVFDLRNRVIAVNPAFEKLYGWKIEECYGKKIPMVPPEHLETSTNRIKRMLEGESFDLLETVDMKKDGTTFEAEVTLSPLFNAHGEIIATSVITRDISYRKEAEQLLLQSEKLNLAGEIAAGVAHEIRNPLTVISGFTQMLKQDKDSPYAYYYQLIDDEIKRINLIISEFLVLSKPHTKATQAFDLHHVLEQIVLLFTPQLKNNLISHKVSLHAHSITIDGDENQIKQVFINILKNSIEAIGSKGTLEIATENSNSHIIVHFTDSGIGMSQSVIDNIFVPFYTTKEQGTGLGMMISQKIIQEHNGDIKITSEPNVGTTVSIKLPIASDTNKNPFEL